MDLAVTAAKKHIKNDIVDAKFVTGSEPTKAKLKVFFGRCLFLEESQDLCGLRLLLNSRQIGRQTDRQEVGGSRSLERRGSAVAHSLSGRASHTHKHTHF